MHEMYLAGIDMRVLPGAFSLHVGVKGADPMNGIVGTRHFDMLTPLMICVPAPLGECRV